MNRRSNFLLFGAYYLILLKRQVVIGEMRAFLVIGGGRDLGGGDVKTRERQENKLPYDFSGSKACGFAPYSDEGLTLESQLHLLQRFLPLSTSSR